MRANIWANRFTPGGGWETAELIENENGGDAKNSQVAVDANGNAIAVWQGVGLRANRYAQGIGWGTAEDIRSDVTGGIGAPDVAVSPDGHAIAVWPQLDGTRTNTWANRYVPGDGWGTAEIIETDDAGGVQWPQVAMDPDGNAVAVWLQSDGDRTNIWANQYTVGVGWAAAELIENEDLGDANFPHIAVDPDGKAIAVWSQHDGMRWNVWANRLE